LASHAPGSRMLTLCFTRSGQWPFR